MGFVIRSAHPDDLEKIFDLSRQFTLMNLPSDKKTLSQMIEESQHSFAQTAPAEEGLYLFVAEDTENQGIAASSLIHGRCGTEDWPNYSYKILKKDLFSEDLGIGFIHQVLQLHADTDGPSEIGGLLVDKSYRRRPERLGKQISFSRFCYMALNKKRFTDEVHVELAPPLTDEGRSEFWEALGRRFTGLPYQEADLLSRQNKEFISSLFPKENIYLSLLDAKARLVLGRVGEETRGAQYMLESIGFKYINEVDPFDGGPHYRAKLMDLLPVKAGSRCKVKQFKTSFRKTGIIGVDVPGRFVGGLVSYETNGKHIAISPSDQKRLGIEEGQTVFISPLESE